MSCTRNLREQLDEIQATLKALTERTAADSSVVTDEQLNEAIKVMFAWRKQHRLQHGSIEAGFAIRVKASGFRPVIHWNSDLIEAADAYCAHHGIALDLVSIELCTPESLLQPARAWHEANQQARRREHP